MRYAINGLLSLTCDGAADPRREPREGALDRRRGLDQGGPGRRPRGRRVDDPRLQRDRRQPQRHRAVPRAPEAARAHPAAHHRVVHQDLRDHPPGRAVRVRPRPAASRRCTTPSRSSARSSSRPRAGSGRTGTSPTPACSRSTATRVMPREHEWDSRWWSPIINAEHLRMREAAGVIDLIGVPDPRHRRARVPSTSVQRTCVAQCDVAVGKVDLHAGARRQRRLPLRPHRDAARRRPLPRGHRRRARHGRPQVVHRPPGRRRRRSPTAPTRSRPSASGVRGPATSSPRSPTPTSSDEGFGFLTCREIEVGGATVLASRISYVGELGWELYVSMDDAAAALGGPARHR